MTKRRTRRQPRVEFVGDASKTWIIPRQCVGGAIEPCSSEICPEITKEGEPSRTIENHIVPWLDKLSVFIVFLDAIMALPRIFDIWSFCCTACRILMNWFKVEKPPPKTWLELMIQSIAENF